MNHRGHWILNEAGEPVECDLMTWAKWFQNGGNRVVAKTNIGQFEVSTVFLGIDHNYGGGPPHLWETIVFSIDYKLGHRECERMERCGGNLSDAKRMHDRIVAETEAPVWPPVESR